MLLMETSRLPQPHVRQAWFFYIHKEPKKVASLQTWTKDQLFSLWEFATLEFQHLNDYYFHLQTFSILKFVYFLLMLPNLEM